MKKILLVLSLVLVFTVNVFAVTSDEFLEAAESGSIDKVQKYINSGGDLNIRGNNGITALMIACDREHIEIVKLLIAAGADLNAKDDDGFTALMIADKEIGKLLKAAGATN